MHNRLSAVLQDKGHQVFSIGPTATVRDAVHEMNRNGVGALLVMDGNDVAGIFTERDVLRRVLQEDRDPASTKVGDVMTRELVVVRPTTKVEEAMAVVTEKRCRHLPVLDGDRLVGVVSIGDLTRWVSRNQAIHIKDLVNYITGKYPA